jgi:hypothetical protein
MSDDFAMGYALGQDNNNNNCNDGFGFGGGGIAGIIWIIVIAALFGGGFGWGGGFGGGFGGGAGLQGVATRADINAGFQFQDLQNGVRGIQQGICDSTYAINNAITGGFHGVDNALCNLGYQTQQSVNQLSHQVSDCCCENRAAIAQVRYDMATQACDTRNLIQNTTRDIIDGQNANTRAILDFLTQDKIASLQAENQTLKFAASQAQQNAFITANQEAQTAELIRRLGRDCPVPAYVVPNPNCCYGNPVGVGYAGNYNGGCGSCC